MPRMEADPDSWQFYEILLLISRYIFRQHGTSPVHAEEVCMYRYSDTVHLLDLGFSTDY